MAPTAAGAALDSLGPGFISGLFSADGVPDDVLAGIGEEGVCRQVCGSLLCFLTLVARSWGDFSGKRNQIWMRNAERT